MDKEKINTYKVKSITNDEVVFTNGHKLIYYHEQQCCEYNYADFSSLKDTVFEDAVYDGIVIESFDYGVLVNGHMVNCYSEQEGYYSTDVEVHLVDAEGVKIKSTLTTGVM